MSNVMFFWIWGINLIPYWSSGGWKGIMIFVFPFILISFGVVIEITFLLKSYFTLRKDNTKLDVISRSWIKIGMVIIGLEILWILWLFVLMFIWPYGQYYIEVPIFFLLISGSILITTGSLYKRLD